MRINRNAGSATILVVLGVISSTILAAPAVAGGTTNLAVTATVTGSCKVVTPPGSLNFGAIDPTATANATATASFTMACTTGVVSTSATDNNGLTYQNGVKNMKHSTTGSLLPYSVAYSGDTGFVGTGFGNGSTTHTVSIAGTITPAQFANATATASGQSYNDTVIITVNP